MSFEKYGLSPKLLSGLADVRIDEPTPLQQHVIPEALEGRNMFVMSEQYEAQAFLIPALQKLVLKGEVKGTNVLILTPSIERAKDLDELIWAMGYHAQISSALIDMKGDRTHQEQDVQNGAPVIVANPGRLIEILEKHNHHMKHLDLLILDEADKMENHSLVNRVRDILRFISSEPQVLMITARENGATSELEKTLLKDPVRIGFSDNGQSDVSDKGSEPATMVDMDEVEEKLEEASVSVVLNPEEKETEANDHEPEAIQEKLEEAEVEVVLNPDEPAVEENQATDTGDADDSQAKEATEFTEADLKKAKETLKTLSIDVVLKEDQVPGDEGSDGMDNEKPDGDVEPVYADPILQGEKSTVPAPVTKGLEQGYINVPPRMKISTLMAHLEASPAKRVVVFAASNRTTDRLFRIIRKKNWGVVSISDNIDKSTRNERFSKFSSGQVRILLVGGLAASDVDIQEVQEVINYDVPNEVEEYRYRAELVGQGKAAQIISLVSKMDRNDIKRITDEVGYPPVELPLPEEVADKKKQKKTQQSGKKKHSKGNNKQRKAPRKRGSGNDRRSGKKLELPRPTYDGLSGGREGNSSKEEKGGLIGWIKNLFD